MENIQQEKRRVSKFVNGLRNVSATSMLQDARNSLPFYPAPESLALAANQQFQTIAGASEQVNQCDLSILVVAVVYHSRIGELLNAMCCDISRGDMVTIEGLKGSASYQINLPGIWEWRISQGIENEMSPLWPTTYKRVYTTARKLGIFISIEGSKNLRVTHAARYLAADAVAKTHTQATVTDILHHNSAKSALKYLNRRSR